MPHKGTNRGASGKSKSLPEEVKSSLLVSRKLIKKLPDGSQVEGVVGAYASIEIFKGKSTRSYLVYWYEDGKDINPEDAETMTEKELQKYLVDEYPDKGWRLPAIADQLENGWDVRRMAEEPSFFVPTVNVRGFSKADMQQCVKEQPEKKKQEEGPSCTLVKMEDGTIEHHFRLGLNCTMEDMEAAGQELEKMAAEGKRLTMPEVEYNYMKTTFPESLGIEERAPVIALQATGWQTSQEQVQQKIATLELFKQQKLWHPSEQQQQQQQQVFTAAGGGGKAKKGAGKAKGGGSRSGGAQQPSLRRPPAAANQQQQQRGAAARGAATETAAVASDDRAVAAAVNDDARPDSPPASRLAPPSLQQAGQQQQQQQGEQRGGQQGGQEQQQQQGEQGGGQQQSGSLPRRVVHVQRAGPKPRVIKTDLGTFEVSSEVALRPGDKRLKQYKGQPESDDDLYCVEAIVAQRSRDARGKRTRLGPQYLVKWEGFELDASEDGWVPHENLAENAALDEWEGLHPGLKYTADG